MKHIRLMLGAMALVFLAVGVAVADRSPAGTYRYTKAWTAGGRELALRFSLVLRDNGEARLVTDRQGEIPITEGSLERHGRILEFLIARGRAVHMGRWTWGFNSVSVDLSRLSDGRIEDDRDSHMDGRWYGRELVFSDFNRRLYGQDTDFRFTRTGGSGGGGFGWEEALIIGGALVALGALFDDKDKPKPPDEPVRQAIQAQLDEFARAWSQGDMEAVSRLIPGNFVFYDANGTEHRRPEFLDSVRRRVEVVKEARITATLTELTTKPNEAIGIVKLRTTGTVADWWGAPHALEVVETARMFWEKDEGRWLLQSARSLQVEQKVDGKVVAGFQPWEDQPTTEPAEP